LVEVLQGGIACGNARDFVAFILKELSESVQNLLAIFDYEDFYFRRLIPISFSFDTALAESSLVILERSVLFSFG
jgi:hypothetical protein